MTNGWVIIMHNRKIYDITRTVSEYITVWPEDERFKLIRESSFEKEDDSTLSRIDMCLHTGTHVDAPLHFIENGETIEEMELSKCLGTAKVFDMKDIDVITFEDIENLHIVNDDIVLFKTKNSLISDYEEFKKDYVYLAYKAAKYLAGRKIKTVGIDYLSVENYHDLSHATHKILLKNDICILENICLKDVPEGRYFLSALPLKIEGAEASPVRAALIELE